MATLKGQRSYKQAKGVIEQIRLYHVDGALYGNRKVRDWDHILERPIFAPSTDWIEELGWLAHGFCASAPSINRFLKQRKAFGAAYLLGHYDKAKLILEGIGTDHGPSFWLAERQLMLRQASGGFDEHKAHLAELQGSLRNPVVGYIITMLSNRLEPHVQFDSFSRSVESSLSGLRTGGHAVLAALIEGHVSPWTCAWKSKLHDMLHWCNHRPLADRYNVAIKLLSYAPMAALQDHERLRLSAILNDLGAIIEDHQLLHLHWALTGEGVGSRLDETNEQFFSAYDCLVTGRPEECVEKTKALLTSDPTSFDLYWLLARARVCCGDTHPIASDQKCTASDILRTLEDIAENRIDLNLPFASLQTHALKLGDNHIGISLWQFAERNVSGDVSEEACRYAAITGKVHSPESLIGVEGEYRRACVRYLESLSIKHPSVDLFLYGKGLPPHTLALPSTVTLPFASIALAERAATAGAYEELLEIVAPVLEVEGSRIDEKSLQAGEAARFEFEAQVALNRPEQAAGSVLRHYISNRNLLRNVPFQFLVEGAQSGKWPELRETIFWPILIFLNNGDAQDLYEAVDDFLLSQQLRSPSDLLDHTDKFPNDAIRVLFRDVLVTKVLSRGALWAKTPEAQRQLRTRILQALYSISVEDQAHIVKELSEIEQARILEEAYRNVEGPKFFLDFSEVNRSLAVFLESSFERYCSFRAYEEKGGQLAAETDLLELAKSGVPVTQLHDKKAETSDVLLGNLATIVFMEYLWNSETA